MQPLLPSPLPNNASHHGTLRHVVKPPLPLLACCGPLGSPGVSHCVSTFYHMKWCFTHQGEFCSDCPSSMRRAVRLAAGSSQAELCHVFVQPYLLFVWPMDLWSLQESECLEPLFAVPINRMDIPPSLLWTRKKTQNKTQHGIEKVFLPLHLIHWPNKARL